jgi:hypothetical protein
MDAVQSVVGERLERPASPTSADDHVKAVGRRYDWLERNALLMRAMLSFRAGREVKAAFQRKRVAALARALSVRVAHLEPARARAIIAIVSVLDDADTWRVLRDDWGLPIEDAAWAAEWAARVVLAELREEGARGSRQAPAKKRFTKTKTTREGTP